AAFARGKERFGFRLVHFSVQHNHLHLLCEAKDKRALTRGMQGLAIRVARQVNKALRRTGKLFAERYHERILRTPNEVRRALIYVLNNPRRHAAQRPRTYAIEWAPHETDPVSSGGWFDGWSGASASSTGGDGNTHDCPIVAPATWLLSRGWRRHG